VYKLRCCDNGQDIKSYVHSNRLRPFNESRDMFYSRNAPSASTSTDTTQNTNNTDIQQPTADLGDGWYEIEKVTNRRMIAGKHFLVH